MHALRKILGRLKGMTAIFCIHSNLRYTAFCVETLYGTQSKNTSHKIQTHNGTVKSTTGINDRNTPKLGQPLVVKRPVGSLFDTSLANSQLMANQCKICIVSQKLLLSPFMTLINIYSYIYNLMTITVSFILSDFHYTS